MCSDAMLWFLQILRLTEGLRSESYLILVHILVSSTTIQVVACIVLTNSVVGDAKRLSVLPVPCGCVHKSS